MPCDVVCERRNDQRPVSLIFSSSYAEFRRESNISLHTVYPEPSVFSFILSMRDRSVLSSDSSPAHSLSAVGHSVVGAGPEKEGKGKGSTDGSCSQSLIIVLFPVCGRE